jgi:hypothetical protein
MHNSVALHQVKMPCSLQRSTASTKTPYVLQHSTASTKTPYVLSHRMSRKERTYHVTCTTLDYVLTVESARLT